MSKNNTRNTVHFGLKVAEYVAYLIAFSVPLVFSKEHFYTFNSSKLVVLMGLVAVMVLFFSFGKWKERDFKLRISPLSVAVLFFIVGLVVSAVFGVDPVNSFFGWGHVVPLVAIIALAIFSFMLASLIREDRKIIAKLLACIFFSGVVSVIFFYAKMPGGLGSTEGSTLGNSSYFGAYLLFAIASGVGLLIYKKKVWQRVALVLGLIFIIFNPLFINKSFLQGKMSLLQIFDSPTSILGIANGATMGLGLAFLLSIFLFMICSKKRIFKIGGIVLASALFIGVFLAGQSLVKEGTLVNKVFTEEKSENRFIAWDIAKKSFSQNIILGTGHNNYIYSFEKFYNPDFYKKENAVERFLEPHNVVWEFASNGGVVGILGYLGLLAVLFLTLCKRKEVDDDSKVGLVLASLVFGYFVQNLFVFDTTSTYTALFVIVAIALGQDSKKEWHLRAGYSSWHKIFIILAVLGALVSLKVFSLDPSSESREMNKILTKTKNMADFAPIRDGLPGRSLFGGVMDYTYQAEKLFKIYQKSLYKIDDENKEIFLREIDSVVGSLEKTMERQPYFADAHLVTSEMLNLRMLAEAKTGDTVKIDGKNLDEEVWEKSLHHLSKYSELNKRSPQGLMALAQLYMIRGDFAKAKEYSKMYMNIAPEYEEGYEFARGLLKIKPDREFESFIDQMQKKWIHP